MAQNIKFGSLHHALNIVGSLVLSLCFLFEVKVSCVEVSLMDKGHFMDVQDVGQPCAMSWNAGCLLIPSEFMCVQGLIRHFRGEMEDRIGRASELIAA